MVEQIKTGLTGQDEALFAATQQEKPTTRILPRQASLLRLFNHDVQGFYMLPWVKVPTLGLLRWFEGEKFTPEKPCHEVLAIAAYRAIIAAGERHRWGRRVFAAHCALSDFRARKIIDEAIEDSASQMHPTRIQGPSHSHPETIPEASKNLPQASREHPSISRQTATSEQSISDLSPASIPDASHSHPNVNPPASKEQPASIPHARAFLDSDKRVEKEKEVEGDLFKSVPPQKRLPKMLESISSRQDIDHWADLWEKLKPAERDVFLDVVQIWDAFVKSTETEAKGPTTTRYAMLRSRLKAFETDTICRVPEGCKRHEWTVQHGKQNEFEWMFQERNIEKFAALAQNKTSKTDGLGRMQHGDDMGEIWTFKKTRS